MKIAINGRLGDHFSAFAKAGHGRETSVRTVLECDVSWRLSAPSLSRPKSSARRPRPHKHSKCVPSRSWP